MINKKIDFIKKRDGQVVPYEETKIAEAIYKAAKAIGYDNKFIAKDLANAVTLYLERYYEKEIPTSDEIHEMVEKILFETGNAKIGKAFILYKITKNKHKEYLPATSLEVKEMFPDELIVDATTRDEISIWGRERIASALVKEANISEDVASEIAQCVEQKIFKSGLKRVSTSLIRELVNNELFERGLDTKLKKQLVIGLPKHDLGQMLSPVEQPTIEDKLDPETLSKTIGENALRQYALQEIFSKDIAEAHLEGSIHIHNLDHPVKLFWLAPSIEYIRRYGIRIPPQAIGAGSSTLITEPASSARAFTTQLNLVFKNGRKFFSEGIEFSHINTSYAPFCDKMNEKEIETEVTYILTELLSNLYFNNKPSLAIGLDIGLPISVISSNTIEHSPDIYKFSLELIKQIKDYKNISKFIYINESSLVNEKHLILLKEICKLIANGFRDILFIFERKPNQFLNSSRYIVTERKCSTTIPNEEFWYSIAQAISVNLPQVFYRSGGASPEGKDFYQLLENTLDIVVKAHTQKRQILMKYLARKDGTFGHNLGWVKNGTGALRLKDFVYVISFIGLNETIKLMCGEDLGESETATSLAHRIVSYIYFKIKEGEQKFDIQLSLEDIIHNDAIERLSHIDSQIYPRAKGLFADGKLKHYSNSFHLGQNGDLNLLDRLSIESRFHTLINSGTIVINPSYLSSQDIFSLIYKAFYETQASQLYF